MTRPIAARRGWWWRVGIYLLMALIMVAMHAVQWWQPHRTRSSVWSDEQAALRLLDQQITPPRLMSAVVQEPALGIALILLVLLALGAWLAGGVLLASWWSAGRLALPCASKSVPAVPVIWSMGDVLRIAMLGLFAAHMLPAMQLVHVVRHQPTDLHEWILASMLTLDGTVLVAVFVMAARRLGARWPRAIGWRTRRWWQSVGQGLVGYVATIPPLSIAVLIVVVLATAFRYEPPPEPVLGLLLNETRWSVLLAGSLFIAVLGPVVEETFFRGVLYAALRRRWGVRWGLLASGVCFAALHTTPVGFLPIWLLGVVLAYLYETTGSLVPSITLHILHNTAILASVWLTKGMLGVMGR